MRIYRILVLSLIPQWFLLQWAKQSPEKVDLFYTMGIYKFLSPFTMTLSSWIPFSVGDLLYIIVVLYLLRKLISFRFPLRWSSTLKVLGLMALFIFIFHVQWGYNYHKTPIAVTLNIKADYSTSDLVGYTHKLIEETNTLHGHLSESDSTALVVPYSKDEIFDIAVHTIRKTHPYPVASIKGSLLSFPLSYMGYGGYLNPFTLEAQVNTLQPKVRLLTTSVHEIAHQLGYAAEEEANYIAIQAAVLSEDPYMQYAGHSLALQYCMSEVRKRDAKQYKAMVASLQQGVMAQFQEIAAFWTSYQNPFEPLFKKSYDSYLKANNQTEGIKSYNLVVGLLLNGTLNK